MKPAPAFIRNLPTIDDKARDGKYRLLSDGDNCAVGRWHAGAWVFSEGHLLDFTPDRYRA